jgi:xylulokinase
MSFLLGIDLGTSSVKCMLMAADGSQGAISEREYPILTPQKGWAEQKPDRWWVATVEAVREVVAQAGLDRDAVKAIGLSGQMHSTVLIGADRQPLRPAIIWPDQRSSEQCQQIYQQLGYETLAEIAGSGVFPGFMLASLLWVQQNEPHVWDQLDCVLFPKDYIRFCLTGELATEVTDASGGLLLNVKKRDWSKQLTANLSVSNKILPPLLESQDVAGRLTTQAAQSLGLWPGIPVVAGAADQATGALGSGLIEPGVVMVTLGTGGQLVTLLNAPRIDRQLRIHTFCHAVPEMWYLLGATLSAGLSFRWLRDAILQASRREAYQDMTALAEQVPPGAEGLLFLPYLVGERVVQDIPQARGAFLGLTVRHTHAHLVRATMEGIVFSLRRLVDVFEELDVSYTQLLAAGGGARSPLWCQMVADIFQAPVVPLKVQEQSALGAIMLAGLGTGTYPNATEACRMLVSHDSFIEPRSNVASIYQDLYGLFSTLYTKTKADIAKLSQF